LKILITGPESTGKTTISKYISTQLDATYIPEFARIYLEKNGPCYVEQDLSYFAKEHLSIYTNQNDARLIVFDTSLIDIVVWSLYKYGRCDPWIIDQTKSLHFDLIFLTTPAVAWTEDALRENENNREELYALFKQQLNLVDLPYTILHADEHKRERQVIKIINNHKDFLLQ